MSIIPHKYAALVMQVLVNILHETVQNAHHAGKLVILVIYLGKWITDEANHFRL